MNNNHDGGFDSSAKISVNNSLFSPGGTGKSNDEDKFLLGTFSVTVANSILNVAYSNEQFYVSAMEIVKTSGGLVYRNPPRSC